MTDTVSATLFDIDGTLVDSNYLHIEAWSRAFADVGAKVDSWRIHRSIGMDSAKLLEALLGDDMERLGSDAKERHCTYYAEMTSRLRPFDGARELVRELARRGATVVLATSASEQELAALRDTLEIEDAVARVTSAEDVESAKPDPDIVQIALKRADASADHAVFIGDSVWDVAAAGRAGVRCIGVLSGGTSAAELLDAGAIAVYEDTADLLEHLDESPLASQDNG